MASKKNKAQGLSQGHVTSAFMYNFLKKKKTIKHSFAHGLLDLV